ncbi:MAG: ATP-binding protein [Anaerolineae bacterium]|nr:ATP-binding protein [Anaerolineae bacterium]
MSGKTGQAQNAERKRVASSGTSVGDIYQGVRKATVSLLGRRVEDLDFECKESVSDLKSEHMVAFANSSGGVIFVGVQNNTSNIVGDGDSSPESIEKRKRNIIQKCRSCIPPVPAIVDIENIRTNRPLFVIRIPPSNELCCTKEGIYKKRENGQNTYISPGEIKVRVLEMEASVFASRLETAAKHIEQRMQEANSLLSRIEAAVAEAIDASQDAKTAAREATDAAYDAADAAESH